MSRSGPIIILDDDLDDQELIETVIREIGITNKLIFFGNGEEGLAYLRTTEEQPLLVFSDVNMPLMGGIDFKIQIDQDPQLRKKSIPFVILTTSANKIALNLAFTKITVQGFFEKPSSYEELKSIVKRIIDYWMNFKHPNSGL